MTRDEAETEIALKIKKYFDNRKIMSCLKGRLREAGNDLQLVARVLTGNTPHQTTNPLLDIGSGEFYSRVTKLDKEKIVKGLDSLREAAADNDAMEEELRDSGYSHLIDANSSTE